MRLDPYDVRVAFDDLYEDDEVRGGEHNLESADDLYCAIARKLASRRFSRFPSTVEVFGRDVPHLTYEIADVNYTIIGAAPVGRFPVFDVLRERFAASLPPVRIIRLDSDEESHAAYWATRRALGVERLEARLRALEEAHARHVADGHARRLDDLELAFDRHLADGHGGGGGGGGGGGDVVACGDAVIGAICEAATSGVRIPLDLPPWAEGKIDCRRVGREVVCTARFLDDLGRPRIATTGGGIARHVAEVVGCAMVLGIAFEDVVEHLPALARRAAGDQLVAEICYTGPMLARVRAARTDQPLTARVEPRCDLDLAAAMALLQNCQRGVPVACREASAIGKMREGKRLLSVAGARLVDAQAKKSRA